MEKTVSFVTENIELGMSDDGIDEISRIRRAHIFGQFGDFISKMSIAANEARETKYWLKLLDETDLSNEDVKKLIEENTEIINILSKIVKTSSGK